jgi:hypothetical protein
MESTKTPIFGVDSIRSFKEWYAPFGSGLEPEKREVRVLFGVVVNPLDKDQFEIDYNKIMNELFGSFNIPRIRPVYKSSEIGRLFGTNVKKFMSFCLNFMRKVLNLDYVKVSYCMTRLNSKQLVNGKVIIGGEYGSATRQISVPEFMDMLSSYYNTVCAWKVAERTGVKFSRFLFDGEENIARCHAWNELSHGQKIEIVFNGDKTEPVLSSADIILKSLNFFFLQSRAVFDEKKIEQVILYGDKVKPENKFFIYIGNPDLEKIKPLTDQRLSLFDLRIFIRHPIIYVGAGGIPGQKATIENLLYYDKLIAKATELHAGLRIYDPYKDSRIIGQPNKDYFVPLNSIAEAQLETLIKGGHNIEKLEITEL